MVHGAGAYRRRKRFERFEFGVVWVVAVDTEQILLVSVPISGAFAVDTNLPVTEFVTVTLAAQSIRFSKINQLT